ncbi:hypothetical protein NE686_17215 [Tissierella carlieri]|uniref:Lipoprotein n=1 Tax=Tissierella carlieri TaxID=689904 RepID=A0ABT1SEC9_9FIRM|nr:hypothetical protein [Tissierella carlieri]MCQ4924845.1 hypothetical protein [Tissierella carlieri]
MKKTIGLILIIAIVGISIYMRIETTREEKELSNLNVEEVNVDKIKDETKYIDLEDTLENYDKDVNETLKSTNYPIMKFFKAVNNKDFKSIDVYPEYREFFSLEEDFLKENYNELENLFYEITGIGRKDKILLIDVRYKEEDSDEVYSKTFSTDGRYLIDEAFIGISDLKSTTEEDSYKIVVEGKVIYKDREVYKIRIKNKAKETIKVDPGMYGFYAINDLNKYYHKLLYRNSGYEVLPNGESLFYVEFPSRDIGDVYINIMEKDVLIFRN